MSDHSHHPAISRRNLMILGGVALVAGALPASFHLFEPDNGTLADKLMSLLTDKEGAARLGVLLMQAHSLPRETDAIAATIERRVQTTGWTKDGTPAELRDAIAARIKQDYVHGDMVDLSGWQLARTSAELCALAASMTGATEEAPAEHE